MKLIIAIVENNSVNPVVEALMDEDVRTTKLASTGGFLKSGNTTLLIGVKKEEVNKIVEIIGENCRSKEVETEKGKVRVGGANLFVIDMDEHIRI